MSNTNTDKTREQIAEKFYNFHEREAQHKHYCSWDLLEPSLRAKFYIQADQIIAIPELLVKADNQKLPNHHISNMDRHGEDKAYYYHEAQQDMLKAGYIKCEPKETKCKI